MQALVEIISKIAHNAVIFFLFFVGTFMEQSQIGITEAASKRVLSLVKEENNPNLRLRVYITGGGCAGFQYGFSFDEKQQPDDIIVTKQCENGDLEGTIAIIIDPLSMTYLDGAQVDYTEGLHGAYFSIKNPNAATTCSCGASFSIE